MTRLYRTPGFVWLATNHGSLNQGSFLIMCSIPWHPGHPIYPSRYFPNMKIAHCTHLAGYIYQISLGIPSNRISLQIFDPVLPFSQS